MYSNNSLYTISQKRKKLQDEEFYSNINSAVALGKIHVPLKHKQFASNYMLIKKIFGHSTALIPITMADRNVLQRHGFAQLEYTTIPQAIRQIEQLKNWSNSKDILLEAYSNELFEIRIKELKYIRLTVNLSRNCEFQQGYKVYEKYVEYIAG